MSGKKPVLTGESYVYIHNQPVCVKEFSPQLQREVATKLKLLLLEKTFVDKAKFYVEETPESFAD